MCSRHFSSLAFVWHSDVMTGNSNRRTEAKDRSISCARPLREPPGNAASGVQVPRLWPGTIVPEPPLAEHASHPSPPGSLGGPRPRRVNPEGRGASLCSWSTCL